MNILVIGKFSPDQFGFHIADTLKDMGHKVIQFDPSLEYKYSKTTIGRRLFQAKFFIYQAALNAGLLTAHRIKKFSKILNSKKVDLTICTHDYLSPEEVQLIKKKSFSPIIMWFPDAIAYSNKAYYMISDYDYIFFQDPYAVYILKNQYNKKNILYLPECCNPKYHKFVETNQDDFIKFNCDISTYGSAHNYRTFFFSQLLTFNYKIKIWGPKPPIWLKDNRSLSLYQGEYITNEVKAKSIILSKINLNTLFPGGVFGLNARAFEIAGTGGFQMIHWRAGLAELFDDGKELVSFNNFDELIEKIEYYLPREELRKEIGIAGQTRAYKDHTYQKRLTTILDVVFNNGKAFDIPDRIKK